MIAVMMAVLTPAVMAGETYLDKARVLHAQPLYRTRTVPIRTEVCDFESDVPPEDIEAGLLGNTRLNDPSMTLVDALRRDVELRQPEKPSYRCHMVTRAESRQEIIAYQVRYQYGETVYERRMDQDPGDFVWVRVKLGVGPL